MRFPWLVLSLGLLLPGLSFAQHPGADSEANAAGGGPASYLELEPAFVVNYGGVGRLRYLKTDIALRLAGGFSGQTQVSRHMPYIRHAIVMRLSRATEEELSSIKGKELLRQDLLAETRKVLIKEEGQPFIDDLLFSAFIIQR
ncbi:flagellar basal body-associated FliL family protein [uncultured Oceanicoccus sp.]|uniref:flagellar basal body-associated FliL family protein n=1 Tax=uncultured Oceanicoccus sp. TaxID=1706381 RepID=UPI0030DCB79B